MDGCNRYKFYVMLGNVFYRLCNFERNENSITTYAYYAYPAYCAYPFFMKTNLRKLGTISVHSKITLKTILASPGAKINAFLYLGL